MSDYRQQEENEEAAKHLAEVEEKFDNGELYDKYADWLIHEHDLTPRITNGDTLLHHMENGTRVEDFIYEIAFGKQKLN